jgi:hypothetical protein
MFFTISLVWLVTFLIHGRYSIISHWDAPTSIYAAITLSRIPANGPLGHFLRLPPSCFSCHMPGHPIFLRIFSALLFNNLYLGSDLSVLAFSNTHVYVIRRAHWIYDAVKDPGFTAFLLPFFPLRLTVLHYVPSNTPLFVIFVNLAFIFQKTNRTLLVFVSIAGACLPA